MVAPMVPLRSATSGEREENSLTMTMPAIEHNNPSDASANGKNIRLSWLPPSADIATADNVAAIAMVAIMAPQ